MVTKKTRQRLMFLSVAMVFLFLVVLPTPIRMTTIIVENLPGNDGADIQANWQILDAVGNNVYDGDTVSGTITIQMFFTGRDVNQITKVECLVDGSHWSDMDYVGQITGIHQFSTSIDTTQLEDGSHEVNVAYYLGTSTTPEETLSIFGFNIGLGDEEEFNWWPVIAAIIFFLVVVFVLIRLKKAR